jgi:hypothetical protein
VPLPLDVRAFATGDSIDVPGFHSVCAPAEADPDTVNQFVLALSQSITAVKQLLST